MINNAEIKLMEALIKPEIKRLHDRIKELEEMNSDLKELNKQLINKITT